MTLTQSRVLQYIGIILICGILAGGYWYFHSQASTLNAPGGDSLSKGLVGYWKLDDGSGTTATDSSTNGNNGTLTNGPTWTTGKIGGAVALDGVDDYLYTANNQARDFTTDYTLSAWINPSLRDDYNPIFVRGDGDTDDIEVYTGRDTYTQGLVVVHNRGNGGTAESVQNDSSSGVSGSGNWSQPALSTWTLLTVTYSNSDTLMVYFNGVQVGNTITGLTPPLDTNRSWRFGNVLSNAFNGGNKQFNGSLDEVRLYNRALSGDEIRQLYNLTTPTGVDTSLKGYWSFNGQDISGTTAYDRSGAGNNGTLVNGPTVTTGKVGQALQFDNNNDYVGVSGFNQTLSEVTFSAWVNLNSKSAFDGIIFSRSTNTVGMDIYGNLRYHWTDGPPCDCDWDSGLDVPIGQWVFLVITIEPTKATAYVGSVGGGLLSAVHNVAHTSKIINNLEIGRDSYGGRLIDGKIDEVRIYNRALSASEVAALYNQGNGSKENSSASQPQGTGKVFSGLVDYWRFDDGSGTTATDSGTGAHNGTLNGGGFTWGTGQVNGGLDTTGAGYISTADTSLANNSFTLSAWAKRTTSGTYDYIFVQGSSASTNNMLQFGFRGSNVFMCAFYNNDLDTTGTYTDTNWHYWTCTYDAVSKLRSIYLDGVFLKSDTASADYQGSGAQQIGGSFTGSLDEFRIYSRALSADEVRQIYNLTNPANPDSSLKGYWSFNGTDISGTTAYDRSGAGNNGTLVNSPTVVPGKVGQALSFNGSNKYVTTSNNTNLGTAFTISAWFKLTAGASNINAIVGNMSNNTHVGWVLFVNSYNTSDHRIVFEARNGSGTYDVYTNTDTFSDGVWNYVTLVVSNSASGSAQAIYLNGVSQSLVQNTLDPAFDNTSAPYIGTFKDITYLFNGSIDEVRIYNRALSASEIQTLYLQGNGSKENSSVSQPQGTGRLDSGLAGYWKLDDGSGTTATDSSTNANNGTLTNGPTWTTGKIGGAVDFDGTDDYIDLTDINLVDGASQITFSAWVNMDNIKTRSGVMSKGDQTIGMETSGGCTSNTVLVYVSTSPGNSWGCYDAPLVTGAWQLWTMTFDGTISNSSNRVSFYLNGIKRTLSAGGGFPTTIISSSNSVRLGDSYSTPGGASNRYLDGKIDEARIYSRALSADEVRQLYNLTSPTGVDTSLKGYWSFNGQDMNGTTAYDRSGAGNNGTLTNGPTIGPGKIGQALLFDGTNDYVNLSTTITYAKNASFISMSAWVKPMSFVDYGDIFTESISTNTDWRLGCGFRSSGKPYCGGRSPDSGTFQEWRGNTALSTGNWYHFMAVIDVGNDAVTFYINGIAQVNEATGNFTNSIFDNTSPAAIRLGGLGAPYLFSGSIDEVRIYNRALSASEVAALYNQGR